MEPTIRYSNFSLHQLLSDFINSPNDFWKALKLILDSNNACLRWGIDNQCVIIIKNQLNELRNILIKTGYQDVISWLCNKFHSHGFQSIYTLVDNHNILVFFAQIFYF